MPRFCRRTWRQPCVYTRDGRLSRPPVSRLSNGKAYVQILDVANDEGSDLIVIGVHGRNPVDMTLFGSTANHIVRGATCRVLTLRQET